MHTTQYHLIILYILQGHGAVTLNTIEAILYRQVISSRYNVSRLINRENYVRTKISQPHWNILHQSKITARRNRRGWRQKRQEASFSYKEGTFFIYLLITHVCWQGVQAQRLYYKVDLQGCALTVRYLETHALKQQTLSLLFSSSFSSSFSYKMVQTTIQNICAVDNLQKKVFFFDSIITVQSFFSAFFPSFFSLSLSLALSLYGTPESLFYFSRRGNLGHAWAAKHF